uniref:Uncharacterized protein n=1 Tax=Anguilla anguilla TaxID=7936 RepID=A0A0E9PKX5_ANGAN
MKEQKKILITPGPLTSPLDLHDDAEQTFYISLTNMVNDINFILL